MLHVSLDELVQHDHTLYVLRIDGITTSLWGYSVYLDTSSLYLSAVSALVSNMKIRELNGRTLVGR